MCACLPMETTVFLKSLSLFHCVPLYVCRLCINFQDLCARLLGMASFRILLLTFTSRFVIDFLSIRKVIIFSAIATDDRHPLRSRSIHQNAGRCKSWTLDSGLDHGLDRRLDGGLDFGPKFGPSFGLPLVSSSQALSVYGLARGGSGSSEVVQEVGGAMSSGGCG